MKTFWIEQGKTNSKNGVWYIGGKRKKRKRKQAGGAFPIGLIASIAGPLLGEVAKPIFTKIIGRGTRKKRIRRWGNRQ